MGCNVLHPTKTMQCNARYTESLSTAKKKRNRIKRNENIAKPCIGFQLHAITINKRAYEFLHITTSMVVGSRLFQCSTLFLFTIHWLLLCCLPFWLSYAFLSVFFSVLAHVMFVCVHLNFNTFFSTCFTDSLIFDGRKMYKNNKIAKCIKLILFKLIEENSRKA